MYHQVNKTETIYLASRQELFGLGRHHPGSPRGVAGAGDGLNLGALPLLDEIFRMHPSGVTRPLVQPHGVGPILQWLDPPSEKRL